MTTEADPSVMLQRNHARRDFVAVEAVGPSSVVVHFSTGQRLPVEASVAVVRAAFQDHARERRRDNEPKRPTEPERPRGID